MSLPTDRSQYIEHPVRNFMPRFERFEPIIQDSTAMKLLKRCDRKYFYRIVLGRVPRNNYNQVVLDAGTIYHKFREVLEEEWAKDQDAPKALKIAIAKSLSLPLALPDPNSKWGYINKEMIMQAFAVAYQFFLKEKADKRITVLSQEQPWNVQMPDGTITGGRLDQHIKYNGLLWVRDFKFTSKDQNMYAKLVEPNDQATRYIYGIGKLHGADMQGIIFESLYHKHTKSKGLELQIYTTPTQRSVNQLKKWEAEQIHVNRQLALNRQHDEWPMREIQGCEWCEYANVCRRSSEVAAAAMLEKDFKLQPWDCTKTEQQDLEG